MKPLQFLLLFCLLPVFSNQLFAQEKTGLRPSFSTVTKPELLWLVHIGKKTFTLKKSQVDSLAMQERIEKVRLETGPEATAIYGSRAAHGVVIIQLKKTLPRKVYRELRKQLAPF
ncbi:hypothetical protein C7T94_18250 [Pedobacter yulinensis]|uniref:TonB-dependent receptor plug domain-containing protein n=1 Tax=Pedobacter yulinensis TaxID=2126353 RepID=A0A2T3HHF6_9SPHI|nr:hypothetical protein [Pedobacter yulinensis]PST81811.1 hypothetical protein C7T94_18250 [Pedobacter yulinensis]